MSNQENNSIAKRGILKIVLLGLISFLGFWLLIEVNNLIAAENNDPLKKGELLTFIAPIVVAIIALIGIFYTTLRNISFQREIEITKRDLKIRDDELTKEREERRKEREERRKFRQEQILPFLESLNKVIISSDKVVKIPLHYLELAADVPLLQLHFNKSIVEWLDAFKKMSDHRVKLLLSIDPSRIDKIASLLIGLLKQVHEVIKGRHLVSNRKMDSNDLKNIHSKFVNISSQLMIETRKAVMGVYDIESHLTKEAETSLAKSLTSYFEETAVSKITISEIETPKWIAIWEEEKQTENGQKEFEDAINKLCEELNNKQEILNVQKFITLNKTIYCIAIMFAGSDCAEHFIKEALPNYKKKYTALWSRFPPPSEIT